MGQALYRKHRPKSLNEVVGQEHITQTLTQALQQGRISHAYLFTGPRGVGKTSIARILAHEINELPYADDKAHVDIIEIDAASNRRIDEIRELREKVYVAPVAARYKVYIIDEVHMLTREAFNALLKTLEEPPAHVVFVLATTDAHKLPETIVSRTQRFSFKPVDPGAVAAHLQRIAEQEKIKISSEALQLLAAHGEGSFRDSISLLDQAANYGEAIDVPEVRQLLGLPPNEAIAGLLEAIQSGSDAATVMARLNELYGRGYPAAAIAKELGKLLRDWTLAGKEWTQSDAALQLMEQLIAVPAAHDPERFLEVIMLRSLASREPGLGSATDVPKPVAPIPESPGPSTAASKKGSAAMPPKAASEKQQPASPKPKAANNMQQALNGAIWPEVLGVLKQRHNTLYGVIRMAQPNFSEDGKLVLAFGFAFHEKRLREAANRRALADIIHELTGQTVLVECVLDKSVSVPAVIPTPVKGTAGTAKPDLSAISNIFGGAELLES